MSSFVQRLEAWSASLAAPLRPTPTASGASVDANSRSPRGERCGQPFERHFLCSRSVSQSCASDPQPGRFCSVFSGGRCAGWGGRDPSHIELAINTLKKLHKTVRRAGCVASSYSILQAGRAARESRSTPYRRERRKTPDANHSLLGKRLLFRRTPRKPRMTHSGYGEAYRWRVLLALCFPRTCDVDVHVWIASTSAEKFSGTPFGRAVGLFTRGSVLAYAAFERQQGC